MYEKGHGYCQCLKSAVEICPGSTSETVLLVFSLRNDSYNPTRPNLLAQYTCMSLTPVTPMMLDTISVCVGVGVWPEAKAWTRVNALVRLTLIVLLMAGLL